MITARQLITAGSQCEVYCLPSSATVFDALQMMADKNVGAVIIHEGQHMVGIFSERDYARKIILAGKSSLDTPVAEIMSCDPITIIPETDIETCMELMTKHYIRHLPVIENGQPVGMISMRDVVAAIISDRDNLIRKLEDYILGEGYGQ